MTMGPTDISSTMMNLVHERHSEEGIVLSLPALYPSGASVQIRIQSEGDDCFVNDMGTALIEAELMGASHQVFSKQAREVAEKAGILFDNHCFFAINVRKEQLDGAIRVVAAAAQKAVVLTEARVSEQIEHRNRDVLRQRLLEYYGKDRVELDVGFSGASSREWPFAGCLRSQNGVILFDAVVNNATSVFAAHTKFSDVLRTETPPKGVITVPDIATFKPDLYNLLQQTANIVDLKAGVEVFDRLAA